MLPPHENLVKFYRAWEENQILYMQLELCGERSVKRLCCCCLSSNTGWPVHCMHTQSSNFVCETVSLLVISVQCPSNWYGYFKVSACTYTCEERAADQNLDNSDKSEYDYWWLFVLRSRRYNWYWSNWFLMLYGTIPACCFFRWQSHMHRIDERELLYAWQRDIYRFNDL